MLYLSPSEYLGPTIPIKSSVINEDIVADSCKGFRLRLRLGPWDTDLARLTYYTGS